MDEAKANWRKSRRSDGQGGACVEVTPLPNAIGIRDSKAPEDGHITIGPNDFRALLKSLKR